MLENLTCKKNFFLISVLKNETFFVFIIIDSSFSPSLLGFFLYFLLAIKNLSIYYSKYILEYSLVVSIGRSSKESLILSYF